MKQRETRRSLAPLTQTDDWKKKINQLLNKQPSPISHSLTIDASNTCTFDLLRKSQMSSTVSSPIRFDEIDEEEIKPSLKHLRMQEEEQQSRDGENGEDVECTKPRVRFPVITKGIINPVAITQLQDELENTKKELDRLQATRVPSRDEMILPKRMSLPRLMEMFPAVGDQILVKVDQKLSGARKEDQILIKQLKDEHRRQHLQANLDSRNMESKLYMAEAKLKKLEDFAMRHPNAAVGEVWARIQEETSDQSELKVNKPTGSYASASSPQNSNTLIYDNPASNNPFRNSRWANSDGRKREYDEAAQPEFGRDVKRLRTT